MRTGIGLVLAAATALVVGTGCCRCFDCCGTFTSPRYRTEDVPPGSQMPPAETRAKYDDALPPQPGGNIGDRRPTGAYGGTGN